MEIKIGQYKGIEVEVEQFQVTDEDVERELVNAMQKNPIKESQDRPLQEGDTAIFDFKGLKDGVAFDGGTAENYELVIGSGQFIPGFEEQMVGMVKGEEKALNVSFPENYHAEDLAGQPVVFEVKLHDVVSVKPAELNEEFVKSLNIPDVNTVEEITEFVKNYLKDDATKRTNAEIQNKILDKLIDSVEAEVSEEAVNELVEMQLQRFAMEVQQQGIAFDQYLQMIGASEEALRNQIKPTAQRQAKLDLALAHIVEVENIETTEEEVDAQYEAISQAYGMSVEQAKEVINRDDLKKEFTTMKATTLVFENSKVTFK